MRKKLNINKTLLTVISLNIIQIIILGGLIAYGTWLNPASTLSERFDSELLFLLVIILTSFLNSFFTLRDSYNMLRHGNQYKTLETSLEQVEKLNHSLRAQRHDFLNHLQVVYGLIEMDEYKDAKEYIEKVYSDIQSVSRFLKTSSPAINALLQAKTLHAEKENIKVQLHILARFENIPIPAWELCRVLGNLFDNAVDALKEKPSDRLLTVELYDDLKFFGIRISDNGPMIPERLLEKIFVPGFTTKKDGGHGMGLAISRDIVNQYRGEIRVTSNSDCTVFDVCFPRDKSITEGTPSN